MVAGCVPVPVWPANRGSWPLPAARMMIGLLGLSEAEIAQLARDGIIGTEMLMEEQLVKEKKRAAG